jgi:hypothetical protein
VAEPGRMVALVREQADACAALGSPLYEYLLQRVADDVEAGGPAYDVLRGHEDDPGPSALALRLMGGVHRLVLERRAPALALTYPSVGGSGDPGAAWAALRPVLAEHAEELRAALAQPPQTNEVGRAAALVGGLLRVAAADPRPLRLVEIGTSAGLNLRADHFRIELADGRAVGPLQSPVVLADAWQGQLPPLDRPLLVVERIGCDLAPVDPTTTEGRLLLTSYVWPDQLSRLERLRGALELARDVPATVVAAGAGDFLDRVELREGTTTVVWHSVMWQYLDPAEQARVAARLDELGAQASDRTGFAHLALEPRRRSPGAPHEFLVVLRTWPGGTEQVLGRAEPHGLPTTWEIP